MTPTKSDRKTGLDTGKEAEVSGWIFFAAKEPAKAMTGTIKANRPTNIAAARVKSYSRVFPVRPAKALPLFAAQKLKT